MRLLVTRPVPSHGKTLQQLEDRGHTVFHAPVLHLEALAYVLPNRMPDALIATSAHVFEFLQKDVWVAESLSLPLVAVGARTARAAEDFGFRDVRFFAENATTLARVILDDFAPATRFLHLSARDRSRDFSKLLPQYPIDHCAIYAARAADTLPPAILGALEKGGIDGVLHYSRRSAQLFVSLLEQAGLTFAALQDLRHFCLSENVAEPLRTAGAARIVIASAPYEKALMETISAV